MDKHNKVHSGERLEAAWVQQAAVRQRGSYQLPNSLFLSLSMLQFQGQQLSQLGQARPAQARLRAVQAARSNHLELTLSQPPDGIHHASQLLLPLKVTAHPCPPHTHPGTRP